MIPILLDKVKIPLEFRRKQTADLIAWDGDPSHGGLQGLFEALDGTRPQAPSAPTVTTSTSRPAFQFRPWLTTGGVGFVLGCFVTYLVVSGLAGQERTAFQPAREPAAETACVSRPKNVRTRPSQCGRT